YSKSLAAILEEYPDLDATFELVNYTLGNNVTPESAYGRVGNGNGLWYFQPAYPVGAGASADIPVGDNGLEGISAVGKKPIVLVTLHQKGKPANVVLAGYYKIIIEKDVSSSVIA
ncbi:MAG: hypothetical protein J1D85_00635, partial [Bacteroidales bacterium]|nr:hypothetical protein [Bacteroidales bacterium]